MKFIQYSLAMILLLAGSFATGQADRSPFSPPSDKDRVREFKIINLTNEDVGYKFLMIDMFGAITCATSEVRVGDYNCYTLSFDPQTNIEFKFASPSISSVMEPSYTFSMAELPLVLLILKTGQYIYAVKAYAAGEEAKLDFVNNSELSA